MISSDFRDIFLSAPFVRELGIEPYKINKGNVISLMPVRDIHMQGQGFVHAGVQTTIADHTGGACGYTVAPPGEIVLSAEFKMNLLRPAQGAYLWAHAEVLKAGRRLIVVESSVYTSQTTTFEEKEKKLVSKATITLTPLPAS